LITKLLIQNQQNVLTKVCAMEQSPRIPDKTTSFHQLISEELLPNLTANDLSKTFALQSGLLFPAAGNPFRGESPVMQ
jgi:hypothetical protein